MSKLPNKTVTLPIAQIVARFLKFLSRTPDQIEHELFGQRPMHGSGAMNCQQQGRAGSSYALQLAEVEKMIFLVKMGKNGDADNAVELSCGKRQGIMRFAQIGRDKTAGYRGPMTLSFRRCPRRYSVPENP